MTFAIFIGLVLALFIAFLNVLPVATTLNPVFISSIVTMVGYLKAWNFFLPITELLYCVGIVAVYEFTWWTIRNLTKFIKFIRGHSDGA